MRFRKNSISTSSSMKEIKGQGKWWEEVLKDFTVYNKEDGCGASQTRKQLQKEKAKQAKHYEYIKDYRGDVGSAYLEENKRRVMNRVAKGARPRSKHDQIRHNARRRKRPQTAPRSRASGHECAVFPTDAQESCRVATRSRGRFRSRRVRGCDEYRPPEDDEVDQNVTIEDVQRQMEGEFIGAYDAMSIARWMRANPRQATAKRDGKVSAITTRNQFGSPTSDKTGFLHLHEVPGRRIR